MRRIGTFDLAVVAAISDMPFGVAVSASEKAVNNRQHLAMSRVMEARCYDYVVSLLTIVPNIGRELPLAQLAL